MRPARSALWLRLTLALGLALVGPMAVGWASPRAPIYVSSWAVRVSQGYQEIERLARKFGFVNLGPVGGTRTDGRGRGLDDPRPRQMRAYLARFPRYQGPPSSLLPRPSPDPGTLRGHLKLPPGHLVGGNVRKGGWPLSWEGLHQRNQVPAMQLLPFIPRSSLMGSISICGTGVWSSSPLPHTGATACA